MKKIIKKAGITIGMLPVAAIVGYLLLVAVFFINIPAEKYSEAAAILNAEGYHPRDLVRTGKNDYYHEIYPDILDIGTDQQIVHYSMDVPESSPFRHALVAEWMLAWARYWHGYVVILRPLFRFFDLSEVRLLNAGAQLFLFLILVLLSYRVTGKKRYPLALGSLYFLLIPSATGINFQYSSIYYVAVISSIVLLLFRDFFFKENRYWYFFVLTGIFTSYIDFLTYPVLAWAFPAAFLVLLIPYSDKADTHLKKCGEGLIHLIRSAIAWVIGYAAFWAEKWVIATVFTEHNVIKSAIGEMLFRTGTSEAFSLARRLDVAARNFSHLTAKPFVVLFAVWVINWIVCFIRKGFAANPKIMAFGLMLLSGTAWLVAASNHTNGHHLYTWKNSLATVAAMLMIICISTEYSEVTANRRSFPGRILVAALCAALSLGTYVALPIEEETVNNYSASEAGNTISISEGEARAFEMSFVPRYSVVKNISPLLSCEDKEGEIKLSVVKGDREIESVNVHSDKKEVIVSADVNWHLKAGEEYVLRISTEDVNSPVTLWADTEKILSENNANDYPMVISYTYHAPFKDKATTLFYLMEWFCMYMTLALIILLVATGLGKADTAPAETKQLSEQNQNQA